MSKVEICRGSGTNYQCNTLADLQPARVAHVEPKRLKCGPARRLIGHNSDVSPRKGLLSFGRCYNKCISTIINHYRKAGHYCNKQSLELVVFSFPIEKTDFIC